MTISILGCGWLGLPLALQLLNADHSVNGSTTSPEKLPLLKEKGIAPFLLKLTPQLEDDNCRDFWNADMLVLNIPSRNKKRGKNFTCGKSKMW